jgi:hypothetical protein
MYLDDVVVVDRTFPELPDNIQKVLYKFRGVYLSLTLQKCKLFEMEKRYLRHIFTPVE